MFRTAGGQQIIVMTTAGGMKTVQQFTTTQAGQQFYTTQQPGKLFHTKERIARNRSCFALVKNT